MYDSKTKGRKEINDYIKCKKCGVIMTGIFSAELRDTCYHCEQEGKVSKPSKKRA